MVDMKARCFIVSVASLRDFTDILATLSSLIWFELETGSADAAFNLLGFRRIDCTTTFTHILKAILERVHFNFGGLFAGSTISAEDV